MDGSSMQVAESDRQGATGLEETPKRSCRNAVSVLAKSPVNMKRYKGVTYYRRTGRWEANLWYKRRQHYLGASYTALEAAQAYDKAVFFTRESARLGSSSKCKTANFSYKHYKVDLEKILQQGMDFDSFKEHLRAQSQEPKCKLVNPTYKGVVIDANGQWEVKLFHKIDHKPKYEFLGWFEKEDDAISAYNKAAVKFGRGLAGRFGAEPPNRAIFSRAHSLTGNVSGQGSAHIASNCRSPDRPSGEAVTIAGVAPSPLSRSADGDSAETVTDAPSIFGNTHDISSEQSHIGVSGSLSLFSDFLSVGMASRSISPTETENSESTVKMHIGAHEEQDLIFLNGDRRHPAYGYQESNRPGVFQGEGKDSKVTCPRCHLEIQQCLDSSLDSSQQKRISGRVDLRRLKVEPPFHIHLSL